MKIVTRQDILTGCVKYFDKSSRDWLYLNQARTLLQFLKRGTVEIADRDEVNSLEPDERLFRVMASDIDDSSTSVFSGGSLEPPGSARYTPPVPSRGR